MSLTSVLVLLLVSVFAADALPGGAPAGACVGLSPPPSRHGGTPQETPIPYYIDLSPFEDDNGTLQYTPGNTYTLTLRRNGTVTFWGFLVQCRLVADDMTFTGTFALASGQEDTRLSSCTPNTAGVTHVNTQMPRIEFEEVMFDWTAPAEGTGDVRFAFAVVQTVPVYWSNQRTETVMEGAVEPTDQPTTEAASGLGASVLCLLLALVPLLQL